MQKRKSIVLLFVFAMVIIPWRALDFCITHPLGHQHHHDSDHPSPCQLRKLYKDDGPAIFPPMKCYRVALDTQEYQPTDEIELSIESQILVAVHIERQNVWIAFNNVPPLPPEPKCRSATVFKLNKHRGPPFV